MPLRGLATAFARLADPSAVADPPLRSALTRIRDAMMEHPELVAGERRRIDTALMRAFPKRIVSKGGAEGVLALACRREPCRSARSATDRWASR